MKFKSIILYENQNSTNLYPFSILHCNWEVRCGIFRLYERVQKLFPDSVLGFIGRQEHVNSFLARFNLKNELGFNHAVLLIDSSLLFDKEFANKFHKILRNKDEKKLSNSIILTSQSFPIGYILREIDARNLLNNSQNFLDNINELSDEFDKIELGDVKRLNFLWDTIEFNGMMIEEDYSLTEVGIDLIKYIKNGCYFVHPEKIKIGKNVIIAPGVVIDASEGPVIILDNSRIMAIAVIVGPCFIGENSLIKIGAKIYEKTSIGEWCKVGGEVENSIIHAYSNKQHEGFLGHSYIGEWVNIGADTNTSDLKSTYSNIKVLIEEDEIDTGRMFLGLLCGDHTKTAINTSFTTGSVTGICGIIVNDGVLPRQMKSFAWSGGKGSSHYKLSKALEIARIVMGRRNRILLQEEEELINTEFEKNYGKID
jgi:UDP-N-acetylglucosamine diphosphorylase / glucose-1-phosphate thymidylyltransferase / UDP-N-acetylgalactosamine diphosphorylase / glucosamine-1-phosphate N-acetyltransferase / galactosamine-1-phosphate N-acetyltransferase